MKKPVLLLVVLLVEAAHGATYHVGPGMPFERPSQVAAIALDGDTVEIEVANYDGDVAVWTQNGLTIRGIGGRPHIRARGQAAEGKAIWVIKGDNTEINNIEFSGARVSDQNGAGIRLEGRNLTVRHCYFHNNENGILTGNNPESNVLVEYSEFAENGHGDGYSHNIYVGRVARFTLQYSYSHHARIGHQVKSRAKENYIRFNRLMDEIVGTSSYIIDLPDPGTAYIIGNEIQQGPRAENSALINAVQRVIMVNNTVVNDRHTGVFIRLSGSGSILQNNIFAGQGSIEPGGARLTSNLLAENAGLESRIALDYRLTRGSKAVNFGAETTQLDPAAVPQMEYLHPVGGADRIVSGALDAGAHEYKSSDRK